MGGDEGTGYEDRWGFDRWAARYDELVSGAPEGNWMYGQYDRLLDTVASLAVTAPGRRVLDIGTGTGNLAARLVARGARVTGVDPSPEMLAVAQDKLGRRVDLSPGHFLSLPFEGPCFDAVTSTYALHHVNEPDKVRALRLIDQLLRPGGMVVIGDLMFRDAGARDQIRADLLERGLEGRWQEMEDEHYALVTTLRGTLASLGYRVEASPLTAILWVVSGTKPGQCEYHVSR